MKNVETYVWRWVGGGYNSCSASSKEEALEKAIAMGRGTAHRWELRVDTETLHVAAEGEINALDREYASLFD